jgi:hypothetical protein
MMKANNSLSGGQRSKSITIIAAVIVTLTLLVAGCNKGEKSGLTGETTRPGATARAGKMSQPELKSMANSQGEATAPDRGNFKVVYTPTNNPRYAEANQNLQRGGALEVVADELNATLAIPEDVTITFKECGEVNAYWKPQERSINMCYELMEYFAQTFKNNAQTEEELEQIVGDATTFTFFHELGHGLVDILQLPVTGKEEDAVDQLSTFVLLTTDQREGGRTVLSGAQWFWNNFQTTRESGASIEKLNWADEHSMDGARAFNIMCWTYGSDPQRYNGLVNAPLPEARAVRCPTEYNKLSRAWLSLLKPYLKDAGRRALEQQQQPQQQPGDGSEQQQQPGGQPAERSEEEGEEAEEHGGH